MCIICFSHAIHDPDTVMIMSSYTLFTYATVLASGWFTKMTGPAKPSGLKKDIVIRVIVHPLPVVFRRDVRCSGCNSLVNEQIWGST